MSAVKSLSERDTHTNACGRVHNVLILDNELGMGGLEKKLYDFVSRIDTSHYRVKVCCLKSGGYFKDKFVALGIPFYDELLSHKYDPLAFFKLLRIIHDEKIDLIYTFAHPNTVLFSWLARVIGWVSGVVVSFHAMWRREEGGLVKRWQLPLIGQFDGLIAVAEIHKRYLVESERLDAAQITVIHNGVDTDRYHPGAPRDGLREELGIREGETVVAVVASLYELKRIDVLLEAASRLGGKYPVRVLVVGRGPERENLEALARSLGIDERVTFTGVRDDVDEILRASDLFVLPSRIEAFPNVLLEAMASGLPVISTDVGSVREIVTDGETGALVPAEDVTAMTRALDAMLSDRERMNALGERGHEMVLRRFRLDDMCSKREALFSRILCG